VVWPERLTSPGDYHTVGVEVVSGAAIKPLPRAQAMAQSTGGEHHVPMPAHSGGRAGTGDTLEKQLNGFVRAVALIERLGNALGTLAFTWATVVLLGGYPTVLRQGSDFWFATTIVFLEASR